MSKNNFTERLKKMESQTKQERFSIRKLTIGAASVLIGLGFLGINSQVAHAADGESELNNSIHSSEVSGTDTGRKGAANDVNKSTSTNVNITNEQKSNKTSPKVKLSTYAGLRSFLRDGSEIVESGTTSDGSESAASAPSQEEKENESKKAEAEQKLNAAATSLDTTLGKANEASSSDKYQHETPEKQQALQDAVNKAQEAINKYRDPGSADLPEADQAKLLADINAAQDGLTALLAEYSATQEQVDTQEEVSPQAIITGTDGGVRWEFESSTGTLSYTTAGQLSADTIQSIMSTAGISEDSIKKIAFDIGIKLAANSQSKFANLTKLTEIQGVNTLDASALTDTSYMFHNDGNLTGLLDLSSWQTGSLTSMYGMFRMDSYVDNHYSSLTDIKFGNGWNISKVENMDYMFYYDQQLRTIDFGSQWHSTIGTGVSTPNSGVYMNGMFYNCSSLTDASMATISDWDTSRVKSMNSMFSCCEGLSTLNINNWNTGNVGDMDSMFSGCSNLNNLNLNTWNTSNVRSMGSMFSGCSSLNWNSSDLHTSGVSWNTSNVTDMSGMFSGCSNLNNLNLNTWNTSQVSDMSSMFQSCSGLTSLAIDNWDTGNVLSMKYMFYDCTALNNLDLHHTEGNIPWNTGNVTDMSHMFAFQSPNQYPYVAPKLTNFDLQGWDTSKVTNMSYMFQYDTALTTDLIQNKGIASFITDMVGNMSHMFDGDSGVESLILGVGTHFKTSNVGNMSYMFSGMTSMKKLNIDNFDTSAVSDMSHMFDSDQLLDNLKVSNFDTKFVEDMSYMFNNCRSLTSSGTAVDGNPAVAFDVSGFNTGYVENMAYMFAGDIKLTSIEVTTNESDPNNSRWTTDSVTDMQHMFDGDTALTGLDVSGWDTSQVTNMQYMFNRDTNLASPVVTNWHTGQVTDMQHMFDGAGSIISLDLSNWDTSSVGLDAGSMQYMFNNANDLTQIKLGDNWNTENVTDMSYMFNGDTSLTTLDNTTLDNNDAPWGTANVTNMDSMFNGDGNVADLRFVKKFDTTNVTSMANMFNGNNKITELDLSLWNTKNVTSMNNMFNGDAALTTLKLGSNWNTSKVYYMQNMFNGTSKLSSLNLSAFDTSGIYYGNMTDMFNGLGADASVDKFVLQLGHYRLDSSVWGTFKWQNIKATGTDGTIENPKGTAYDLNGFKTLYNKDVSMCPGPATYVMTVHKDDNKRYKINDVTIKVHKGQRAKIIDQYPMTDILSFEDTETSTDKSYTDLINATDDIKHSNKTLVLAEWLPNKKINAEGRIDDGGVIDNLGNLVTDPPDLGIDKGNAVIKLTFGDGTITNVPVKVQLPKFAPGKGQIVAKDTDPSTEEAKAKAKAGIKTSDSPEGPGPDEWGKSDLTYSWVRREGNHAPLQKSYLSSYGQKDVAVKVTYTTDGSPDGEDIVPVTLLVERYSDAYPISIKPDLSSLPPAPKKITTHAVGDGNTFKVAAPAAFSKDHLNDMNDLIKVTDHATGAVIDAITDSQEFDSIIDHLDWAAGGTPTIINNNPNEFNSCQIAATYTDGTTGGSTGLQVNVVGGKSDPYAITATGVDVNTALTDTNAKAALLNAGNITDAYPNATFEWATSASGEHAPSTSTAGTQRVYIIINYGDGTKQEVPVILKVNNTSSKYSGILYNGSALSIHAADDSTVVPDLNFNAMKSSLTHTVTAGIATTHDPIPASKISELNWATETNSIPGYTTKDIGTQNAKLQIKYDDNSISDPFIVPITVKGAKVLVTNKAYLRGNVPSAADFLSDASLGQKSDSDSLGASYKWVDVATHQELTNLNSTEGIVKAAIEVDYHDGTHQYLPVKLAIGNWAQYYRDKVRISNFTTHIGANITDASLNSHIVVTGLTPNVDYRLTWAAKPDTSAAGLGSTGSKNISTNAMITFTADGSQLTERVDGTVVGAVLKNSNTSKKVYLNDTSLSADQQADVGSYYVDDSLINSYPHSYTVQLNSDKATITVRYNDDTNAEQVLKPVPFTVFGPKIQQAKVYQGDSITSQQVLSNYNELKDNSGITLDDNVSGINTKQVGFQSGQIGIRYVPSDPGFIHFRGSYLIPVIVKVTKRPVDNSMASNLNPGGGEIQVPQYTDLPIHNDYAGSGITNAGAMPAGTNYTWDTNNVADTSTKGKMDKTFVTVHYPDGSVGSVPVKVNVGDPQESDVVLKHSAYLYDKQGKRVNDQILQSGSKVKTYGTTMINNQLYYIIEADKYYVKASNIHGEKRKLDLTAHVYDKYGQQIGDQVIYAGTAVTTYGTPVTIKGQKYYLIDGNKYIKASDFPPTSDTWVDPTVHGDNDATGGVKKAINHAAYLYDKNGKRENKAILKAGSSVVTYGKTTIKHKQYYVLDNDEFLLASNIDAVKRHTIGKVTVVNRYGKATKKKMRKGAKVATYGKAVKIKGIKYYTIGDNRYVKASKLK
ncbi:BspA family leucine-rich repeat surface protein [Lactobacillus sp. ESL0791]|uniref:BspA family leucine-rich repeat surface protein n=1 Tax=Lactobacillus sp. ESL0791 TaxID=2983234 RepID=UPI0023F9EE54|nr:BspA family leucine-rich repeat surface protein [Lactobacillus sp. ESL0791]MDF7639785.1 BspA family leucine-rich repeat surface protein [Lactobacillus sp. ESL0791]